LAAQARAQSPCRVSGSRPLARSRISHIPDPLTISCTAWSGDLSELRREGGGLCRRQARTRRERARAAVRSSRTQYGSRRLVRVDRCKRGPRVLNRDCRSVPVIFDVRPHDEAFGLFYRPGSNRHCFVGCCPHLRVGESNSLAASSLGSRSSICLATPPCSHYWGIAFLLDGMIHKQENE